MITINNNNLFADDDLPDIDSSVSQKQLYIYFFYQLTEKKKGKEFRIS